MRRSIITLLLTITSAVLIFGVHSSTAQDVFGLPSSVENSFCAFGGITKRPILLFRAEESFRKRF